MTLKGSADLHIRPMTECDLPMLADWLKDSRVRRWYADDTSLREIKDHLSDDRIEQWIVERARSPIAYLQDYAIDGWQDHPLGFLPTGARGIDTFMAKTDLMGLGLGPLYLSQHCATLFAAGVPALGIDPEPENQAAIRCYEKIGFQSRGEVTSPWGRVLTMDLSPANLIRISQTDDWGRAVTKTTKIQPDHSVLVRPAHAHLPDYCAALERGWSPDNLRPEVAQEQLAQIAQDPEAFLAALDTRKGHRGVTTLPGGSIVPRLPGIRRWIWQGGFCGSIGLRWQPGTEALPPTCPGHIGYAVVPWRRREGLATAALKAILHEARAVGLSYVDVTVAPENVASVRVAEKAGARLQGPIEYPAALGGGKHLLYRIDVQDTGGASDV